VTFLLHNLFLFFPQFPVEKLQSYYKKINQYVVYHVKYHCLPDLAIKIKLPILKKLGVLYMEVIGNDRGLPLSSQLFIIKSVVMSHPLYFFGSTQLLMWGIFTAVRSPCGSYSV